jgi:hypothetical protein
MDYHVTSLLLMAVVQCPISSILTLRKYMYQPFYVDSRSELLNPSFPFSQCFLSKLSLCIGLAIVYQQIKHSMLEHKVSHLHLTFPDLSICCLLTRIWMSFDLL